MTKSQIKIPTYDTFFNPVLKALKDLGGSGTIEEINQKVIENEKLSDEIAAIPHGEENASQTEVEYRLAWSRTYLKSFGLLENSSRGIWALTPEANNIKEVDSNEVVKVVRDKMPKKPKRKIEIDSPSPNNEDSQPEDSQSWKLKLIDTLIKMKADGFERLAQRILRESGFTQVVVTGKSGDGGIDGKGIARINGFLSFHVLFQCKKYQGSITPNLIRDFRGAMQGRADKGLFITTGSFTREAIKEATRDGAPPIDLIDGEQLADKLNELGLGIKKKQIEIVEIDESWYNNI
jgi:restriction system protein